MKSSKPEQKFETLWAKKYPEIELTKEVRVIPKRRFRFDFVHLPTKTAIEINGGNWIYGRHCRPSSLMSEYTKLNLAQSLNYHIFILTPEMITYQWLDVIYNHISDRFIFYPQNQ